MHVLRSIAYACFALFTCLTPSNAAILDIRNSQLFGAFDVDINGTLYDVQFKDGTCIEFYDGCDQNTDFPFTNPSDLRDTALGVAAHTALLEQVFLDSAFGNFDSQPALTNGCFVTGGCQINTPFQINANGSVGILWAWNSDKTVNINCCNLDISSGSTFAPRDFDTTHRFPSVDQSVYAVWSPSRAVVPAPSTMTLFSTGLVGLVGWRYRKNIIK